MNTIFYENNVPGFKNTIFKNCCADLTLLITNEKNLKEDKLVTDYIRALDKKCISIDISDPQFFLHTSLIEYIALQIGCLITKEFKNQPLSLNITGSKIHTFDDITQSTLDFRIKYFLLKVFKSKLFTRQPSNIRTGGQSGVELSASKFASKFNYTNSILAPKDWGFTDEQNNEIFNEIKFKERFK